MIYTLGTIVVTVGAITAIAFCVAYQIFATWWKSEAGKHLMSFTATLALILTYISIRSWAINDSGLHVGTEVGRLIIFSSVTGLLIWRFVMLGKEQIWGYQEQEEHHVRKAGSREGLYGNRRSGSR